MSSCLSGGGGRTYGLDLEFVKSPSSSTRTTSHTSSPSSTISESSNSPLAISTRKPRTPRKRPNQTYNEAAALLSTAYPTLFSTKNLKTLTPSNKFTKPTDTLFFDESSSELLLPFRVFDANSSSFLLHQHKPTFSTEPKVVNLQDKPCQSPGEISSAMMNSLELEDDCGEDFDAESILDEEMEEGIDSIMGNRVHEDSNGASSQNQWMGFSGRLDFRLGFRRALRHVDDGANWWNFPAVDILQISPKIGNKPPSSAADKKKKKVEKPSVDLKNTELLKENPAPKPNPGLLLKLNYDEIQNAWSDRGSPFADDSPASDVPGNDVTSLDFGLDSLVRAFYSRGAWESHFFSLKIARLSQIDLLWDNGGVREASVLRYKEKRRTRLFSKKIRYQVRKVNADRRPRMKGRFVRRPNSSSNSHR